MATAKEKDIVLKYVYGKRNEAAFMSNYDTDTKYMIKNVGLPETILRNALQEVIDDKYLAAKNHARGDYFTVEITKIGIIFTEKGGYSALNVQSPIEKLWEKWYKIATIAVGVLTAVVTGLGIYLPLKATSNQQDIDSLRLTVATMHNQIKHLDSIAKVNQLQKTMKTVKAK